MCVRNNSADRVQSLPSSRTGTEFRYWMDPVGYKGGNRNTRTTEHTWTVSKDPWRGLTGLRGEGTRMYEETSVSTLILSTCVSVVSGSSSLESKVTPN